MTNDGYRVLGFGFDRIVLVVVLVLVIENGGAGK
jgi:hypothetical protein